VRWAMGTDKMIKFRYMELKEKIKQLWMDLMILSPHLTKEEVESVQQALDQCSQALKGERQS